MTDFRSAASFMNDFEQEIVDISSVNKIIDLACNHIEALEVDNATNLLIALKLILESKEGALYHLFQKAWSEFMVPAHQQTYLPRKTWTVEVGEDGLITFPDDLVKQVGLEEWDLVDVYVNEADGTIVVSRVWGLGDDDA